MMLTIIILLIIALGIATYYYLSQKEETSVIHYPIITPEPKTPSETKPQENPEELPKI
jgi:hypothetical protein